VAARVDAGAWNGKRVFVTGHTGFVGGWLCAWLAGLGARVHGYSLAPPTRPSLFEAARIGARMAASEEGDIRDLAALRRSMLAARPEVLFHLAAQPIVREAWRDPVASYATNVMGTVNVLEAARECASLASIVAYTTDKVYRNDGSGRAFREGDRLGGNEPYSASKAGADWAVGAYWESYFRSRPDAPAVAIVRAGNLIGGGDWASERLVPDASRAFAAGKPLVVRNPAATRPWQHVLDALQGTLLLAAQPARPDAGADEIAWNLGPDPGGEATAGAVADLCAKAWGGGATWVHGPDATIAESPRLRISSEKARARLGWCTTWPLAQAVTETMRWYRAHHAGEDVAALMQAQIGEHA
jgi:CDP-glucose 4,6-dehydratase